MYTCSTCGNTHEDLPLVFGAQAPVSWESRPAGSGDELDELGTDQCVIAGERFFVLGCLDIAILDDPRPFRWMVWVNVSRADFLDMSDHWEAHGRESLAPYPATIDTALPFYGNTVGLKAWVHTRPVGERPSILLEPTGHTLFAEQRDGITLRLATQRAEALLHGRTAV